MNCLALELSMLGCTNAWKLIKRRQNSCISKTEWIYQLCNVGLVNAAILKLMAAEKEEAEHTHLCGSNKTDLSVMQRWI